MFPVNYANGIRGSDKAGFLSLGRAGFNLHENDQVEAKIVLRVRTKQQTANNLIDLAVAIMGKLTPEELAAHEGLSKLIQIVKVAQGLIQ